MSWRATVNNYCSDMPGAECSDPWGGGHDCWKVGGKMFAIQGMEPALSVKCQDVETADMLKEAGVAIKAPYLHRSWVKLPESAALDEARHRIAVSYDIVRSGLTKKAQAALKEREKA